MESRPTTSAFSGSDPNGSRFPLKKKSRSHVLSEVLGERRSPSSRGNDSLMEPSGRKSCVEESARISMPAMNHYPPDPVLKMKDLSWLRPVSWEEIDRRASELVGR